MTRKSANRITLGKATFPMTVRFVVTLDSEGALKYAVLPADARKLAQAISMSKRTGGAIRPALSLTED